MKFRNIDVKVSALALGVFITFTLIFVAAVLLTGDISLLFWGIPALVMLIVIPAALNYMSQSHYAGLVPMYREKARDIRIKAIKPSMLGQPVRIEGVVERAHFKFLNRPQFLVADKSGEVSVKMFTSPQEDVKVNDIVEVLGIIQKRYILTGDPVINCVSIRKISKASKA